MTAKKTKIRALQSEITELKEAAILEARISKHTISNQRCELKNMAAEHEKEIYYYRRLTDNIAEALRKNFLKELTWLELCDDKESKFRQIKQTIKALIKVGEPDARL